MSPELREYERTVTTVVNASLRPRCRAYLRGLADVAAEVHVMTSAGGLLPVGRRRRRCRPRCCCPVRPAACGPAAAVAAANGFPDAITFDMGGTSTDVCLVLDGAPAPAAERSVGGYTVRFPSLDIHTIGAGGGSIAAPRPGGALLVGPRSAGRRPGPGLLRPRRHRADGHRRRPRRRPHPGRRRASAGWPSTVDAAERALARRRRDRRRA